MVFLQVVFDFANRRGLTGAARAGEPKSGNKRELDSHSLCSCAKPSLRFLNYTISFPMSIISPLEDLEPNQCLCLSSLI